jgi:Sulfate permease and related transporters (MFS superfamily)
LNVARDHYPGVWQIQKDIFFYPAITIRRKLKPLQQQQLIHECFPLFPPGFIIDFISGPVSVGFTSAAAIIIATSQIKDLLGLQYSASKFVDVWDSLAHHIRETSQGDAILGCSCMVILFLLRVRLCVLL